VIFCPLSFKDLPSHVKHIDKSTTGIETIFFATIGITKWIRTLQPIKIISFTNLNCILYPKLGLTYFHQFKLLESGHTDFKLKIYDVIIKVFLNKNTFILQTDHVLQAFVKKYPFSKNSTFHCWPGFTIPEPKTNEVNYIKSNLIHAQTKTLGVLPIAHDTPHKNINLVQTLGDFFNHNKVQIATCLEMTAVSDEFINLGTLSRKQLFNLYEQADFMIFPSLSETVGLPIFEFLRLGKPTFIYKADYAVKLFEQFDKPDNMILFEDVAQFKSLFLHNINKTFAPCDFSKGHWDIIFKHL
jgi:hypothetical protein